MYTLCGKPNDVLSFSPQNRNAPAARNWELTHFAPGYTIRSAK